MLEMDSSTLGIQNTKALYTINIITIFMPSMNLLRPESHMTGNKMAFLHITFVVLLFQLVASQKKDVLFIAVDDLRTDLGAYGHTDVKSPNIDALAAKSLLFERAYCQVAICSPSRASLLTGRRADTNHVWIISGDEYWRTTTNATTIPQYFKENGYISIGMGKIFHPGKPSGNDDRMYSWSLPYFHGENKVSAEHNSWHSFDNISDNMLMDGQIADNAVSIMQQIKQNRSKGDSRPFFLATGFHKPHLPFFAPSKYYDMYPSIDQTKPPANPDVPNNMPPIAFGTSDGLRKYTDMKKYNLPECFYNATAAMYGEKCKIGGADALGLRRGYYSALSYTDAQIGRVLKELEAQGLADNTIIVLWADHGWKLGEHNMWTKMTNMEDDTHVPFLLRVPGATDSGMRTKALVELIDIFPSITELAGLPVPSMCPEKNRDLLACVEGSSVAPLLQDPNKEWKKAAFSQFARPYVGIRNITGHPKFKPRNEEAVMGYAIRTDQYRFVEWYSFDHMTATPDFTEVWGTELYDHTQEYQYFNDENVNMAADSNMVSMVKQMRAMLQAGWRSALPDTM